MCSSESPPSRGSFLYSSPGMLSVLYNYLADYSSKSRLSFQRDVIKRHMSALPGIITARSQSRINSSSFQVCVFALGKDTPCTLVGNVVLCNAGTPEGRNPLAWPRRVDSFRAGLVTGGRKNRCGVRFKKPMARKRMGWGEYWAGNTKKK